MDSTTSLLLTGATGQLGSFILAEFLGYGTNPAFSGPIFCSKRPESSFRQLHLTSEFLGIEAQALTAHPQVHFLDLDLSDGIHSREELQDYCTAHHLPLPSTILHAAANINISPAASGPSVSNVKLVNEMLLLAELLTAEHFTHISSIAVMGGVEPLGEEETLQPEHFQPNRSTSSVSAYALGKMGSELAVWRAASSGQSISIVRPGVILGIGAKQAIPQELWRRIHDNKLPLTTDGMTGVVDVRDVAEIAVKMHHERIEGPAVAVAATVTFQELQEKMAAAIGVQRTFRFLPRDPWLERMRSLGLLAKFPVIGKYFTPQMRIMLYSRTRYDGATGAQQLASGYRDVDSTVNACGGFLQNIF
ncbi:MAG: Uncharacterised protein [Cryomorphaceae bacterium]|nr:MAG: Uncharacterised protein [Cryomorphaceae bacterium]